MKELMLLIACIALITSSCQVDVSRSAFEAPTPQSAGLEAGLFDRAVKHLVPLSKSVVKSIFGSRQNNPELMHNPGSTSPNSGSKINQPDEIDKQSSCIPTEDSNAKQLTDPFLIDTVNLHETHPNGTDMLSGEQTTTSSFKTQFSTSFSTKGRWHGQQIAEQRWVTTISSKQTRE